MSMLLHPALPWLRTLADADGGPRCALVGMVHVGALPGSPRWGGDMAAILRAVEADTRALVAGGCDAIIVENMHDLPYMKGEVSAETVAGMALATQRVIALAGAPTGSRPGGVAVGLQVLAGANRQALGVAAATGATFIRAEAFAYGHVADEGWLDASAGPLLRARRALGLHETVAIWADIKKKHAAHAVTADLSLADVARGSRFCGADGLIVTGGETGQSASLQDVIAGGAAGLPVAVGSGVTADNAADYAEVSQALIVGTALKEGGDWTQPVDVDRVRAIRQAMDAA